MSLSEFMAMAALAMTMAATNPGSSPAADTQVWQDPNYDFSQLRKVFIMPVETQLEAGTNLIPEQQLAKNLESWTIAGIRSANKRSTMIIKTFEDVAQDMNFIYGEYNQDLFYKRAAEMGYKAFIIVTVNQAFQTEHVPESYRTYTTYREIEHRDRWGRLIEVTRIPEEHTEIIPAHDVTYLQTVCQPQLYLTDDPNGEYKAAVVYTTFDEYRGGQVINAVENILKSSLKSLFTFKNAPAKPRRR